MIIIIVLFIVDCAVKAVVVYTSNG